MSDEPFERDTKLNIAQRLNTCMAEVEYIQREKKQGMQYSITSHDAVTAKVRPILQKHGVVYYPTDLRVSQNGNRTEAVFKVRFENIDARTDSLDVDTMGYGVDQQDKGPGKAISYGVKYALLKALGLETGDDPDQVQDATANHKPDLPQAGVKLAGPHTSKTALWNAYKKFDGELRSCGDIDQYEAFLATDDSRALLKQCERDAPGLLEGSDSLPPEFVPYEQLDQEMRAAFGQARYLNAG